MKILIANRGEIAVRIIRACREMNIATVAVYSEADLGALHTRMADEAYAIGPAPAAESYLVIDRIIATALKAGAQAIHPGYGFLAENPLFADACRTAGLIFIGPSSESIALMGSKIESRRAAARHGVEMVPGTIEGIPSVADAKALAVNIGYPIMLKASAGGGGKGLRMVTSEGEMDSAWRDASSEARAAFGDDSIYIEKYIEKPRHVEIQVLADQSGNAIHLGERECTIQRRHQKVIEECPSPVVDADLRERMGQAALRIVAAAGYYNAGTVEFLLSEDGKFYFLEMNTRLQVEHAITEAVTGVDLVKEQIRIALGEKLRFRQEDIQWRGTAIECRIYAEDPENNFFPSPGKILSLRTPAGPGIRDDSGVYQGWNVPIHYDPLISKLVAWGFTRDEAIDRMKRALGEYHIAGIQTNIEFFSRILDDPDFRQGRFDTGFIEKWLAGRKGARPESEGTHRDLALLAAALFHAQREARVSDRPASPVSRWKSEGRSWLLRDS